MKLAFSTLATPTWTFPVLAARAKEYGADAVLLRAYLNEIDLITCNPFLTDPKKIQPLFEKENVEIASLSSGISLDPDETRRFIDYAHQLNVRHIKVLDLAAFQGNAGTLADFLQPLLGYAADRNVTILVENFISLLKAADLWKVMDRLNHPAIGICLNMRSSELAGEGPDLVVPTLAKWLKLVKVYHVDGNTKELVHRLRGIGYKGYLSIEIEKLYLPELPEPEEILPQSLKQLREFIAT